MTMSGDDVAFWEDVSQSATAGGEPSTSNKRKRDVEEGEVEDEDCDCITSGPSSKRSRFT
jgi:hypothetical protein